MVLSAGNHANSPSWLPVRLGLSTLRIQLLPRKLCGLVICFCNWGIHRLHDIQKVIIYGDNKPASALTINPEHHSRTKHVEIKWHFVREQVKKGIVSLSYLPDGLTKLWWVFRSCILLSFDLGLHSLSSLPSVPSGGVPIRHLHGCVYLRLEASIVNAHLYSPF